MGGLLTIDEVAGETRHCPASVRSWCRKGLVGPDGRRVRLVRERVGGRVYVRREALTAFMAALNGEAAPVPSSQARNQARWDREMEEYETFSRGGK